MVYSRHLAPLLLLGLLLAGCGHRFHSFDPTVRMYYTRKLPAPVDRSVARNWPGARVLLAERVYGPGAWGDYDLILRLPENRFLISPTLRANGTVKDAGGPPYDPSPGPGDIVLRCDFR